MDCDYSFPLHLLPLLSTLYTLHTAHSSHCTLFTLHTSQPITMQHKVNFALQIAYAMKFLSDSGIVHPDLATRNCL